VGCGLGDGGIGVIAGFRSLGRLEGGFERDDEFIFVHGFKSVGSNGDEEGGGENRL
jgi:hypothetical protein